VDKDEFLHGDKNIISSTLQLLTELPLPKVELSAVAVQVDKPKTTHISKYN